MKKETRQQRYRQKLKAANLKRLEVYINKDDKETEKIVKSYDCRNEVENN